MFRYDDMAERAVYGNLDGSSTEKEVIRAVSEFKNTVVAVDDLPKSSSPAVQRERLVVMEKSIRFISNGTTRTTASGSGTVTPLRCRSGAVCTGEIPLVTASMLTRLLEVPLTEHKKNGGMSDRADAATTFRRWMRWLLPHLDADLEVLRKHLAENRGTMNARLETTNILFLWVTELFYRFAWEEDFVSKVYYTGAVDSAKKMFGSLLAAQAAKVDKIQDEAPRGNLSYYILEGYHKGAFHIVSSRKKIKNNSDCLVEKGALCIRAEELLNYLRSQANFRSLTEKRMSKRLWEEGVLPDTREKRAASKKINGKRYLELCFSVLKEASQKY